MNALLDVTERFDGAALWATLPEELKAAIGAAALEQIASEEMAGRAYEDDRPIWDRVAGAAERVCRAVMMEAFVEGVSREALETANGQPAIPALLGMVCERCGCSQHDACDEGCGWARENLCTACAGGANGAG